MPKAEPKAGADVAGVVPKPAKPVALDVAGVPNVVPKAGAGAELAAGVPNAKPVCADVAGVPKLEPNTGAVDAAGVPKAVPNDEPNPAVDVVAGVPPNAPIPKPPAILHFLFMFNINFTFYNIFVSYQ